MRLILLGPPGVGKGTQADFICRRWKIPQISTGDMLRQAIDAGAELGRRAAEYMEAGELVPDDLIVAMVRERLAAADCADGFLLDGFPRTVAQAEALAEALDDDGVRLDAILSLRAPAKALVERLSGRRVHPGSGRVYHLKFKPPKREGVDDESGEPLVQRDDDCEETVRNRLRVYEEQTRPLIDFYGADERFAAIDAMGAVEEVRERVAARLGAVEEVGEHVAERLGAVEEVGEHAAERLGSESQS